MSKKYIITIKSEYEDSFKGLMILGAKDSNLFVDTLAVDDLEELNSDYINEHFGDLQDTAYQRGLEDGKKATWEAVRKVIHLPEGVVLDLFTDCYSSVCTVLQVFLKYEGSEVIEKLKAYEEKQKADDKIEVGDEVEVLNSGSKYLVAWIAGTSLCGFAHDGVTCRLQPSDVRKTGRHFDIASILEDIASILEDMRCGQ